MLVRFSPKLLLLRFSLRGSLATEDNPRLSGDSPTQNKRAMAHRTTNCLCRGLENDKISVRKCAVSRIEFNTITSSLITHFGLQT